MTERMNSTERLHQRCVFCDDFNKAPGGATIDFLELYPRLRDFGQVLDITDNFVLIPDIGPLTEGHLLLVSYSHVPSFAAIPQRFIAEGENLLSRTISIMKNIFSDAGIIAFEHGVGNIDGQVIQCGTCNSTDHAHLHLLPSFEGESKKDVQKMAEQIGKEYGLRLESVSPLPELAFAKLVGTLPYLFLWSSYDNAAYVLIQESFSCIIPSQILRKKLATMVFGVSEDASELWDWRNFTLLFPQDAEERVSKMVHQWFTYGL